MLSRVNLLLVKIRMDQHKKKINPASKRTFSAQSVGTLANEIASIVAQRLSGIRRPKKRKKSKKIEKAFFLDTSAIIDGRIFEVVRVGLLDGTFVVLNDILLELKRIADSSDAVKRERGRRGLAGLEFIKKVKNVSLVISINGTSSLKNNKDVDELLLKTTKTYKGKLITCDYSLEKKARIENVSVVNINALANVLKIAAVPGESLSVKILHSGKEAGQGVSYLDDGTMVIVQDGAIDIGKRIVVVIARVIQTDAGKILFAKKISL